LAKNIFLLFPSKPHQKNVLYVDNDNDARNEKGIVFIFIYQRKLGVTSVSLIFIVQVKYIFYEFTFLFQKDKADNM
jgi:hypothetical protein